MHIKEVIHNEIDSLPEDFAFEILDFIQFIKRKHRINTYEATVLSESTLKKDWLKPEEDASWENL